MQNKLEVINVLFTHFDMASIFRVVMTLQINKMNSTNILMIRTETNIRIFVRFDDVAFFQPMSFNRTNP